MEDTLGIIISLVFVGIYLLIIGAMLASLWKVFAKAGKPGWAALVPFYNIFIMLEIVGLPAWYLALYLIPCVNALVSLYVVYGLAKSFGKEIGFTLLMIFLPFVGYPMLAFGDAEYVGPALKKD